MYSKYCAVMLRDRNIADVDLLAPNQVQQQVERPFVLRQMKIKER